MRRAGRRGGSLEDWQIPGIAARFVDGLGDPVSYSRQLVGVRPAVSRLAGPAAPGEESAVAAKGAGVQSGQRPQRRPLNRHDSGVAQQMAERAAELARDSRARTRHAAVLVRDGSLLAWGTNGVPFPGEDHCYCKFGESGDHDRCRTHAEQRAIMLARDGDGWRMLQGSKLIYVRLEADDSIRLEEPHFCARCSRLALSLGVAEWIFALPDGLAGCSAADYDRIAQLSW